LAKSNRVSCDGNRILPPGGCFGSEDPKCRPRDEMSLMVEDVVDGGMDVEKTLRGSRHLGAQLGAVYSCNAVASVMKQQRSGKIITVSSVAGTAPSADGGYAHYGAAKAAIAHYTRYLAQDLGPFGITANSIAPGVIATGRIMATVIPGSIQSNRDRAELVALRRLGTVEDCAKVVEFLATDLSDYVTGVVIPIDGGLVRG
jgi:NAD(P)-dependent dehydrogenase (short-subunit alcohol dehydrogenase family)